MRKRIISAGAATILATGLSIDLPASSDMTSDQQGTPLQGVHQTEFGAPHRAMLRHRAATARRDGREEVRGIEFGAPGERREVDLKEYSQYEGMRVENRRGDHLGTVEDLIMNLDNGRVDFVAVSPQTSEREGALRLVPPRAFRSSSDHEALVLDISEGRWQRAPSVRREELARFEDERQSREVYRYYEEDFRARAWGAREDRARETTGPRSRPDRPAGARDQEPWGDDQRADPRTEPRAEVEERRRTEWASRTEGSRGLFGTRTHRVERADDRGPTLNNPRHHASTRGSARSPQGTEIEMERDDEMVFGARDRERREETMRREPGQQQREMRATGSRMIQQGSGLIGEELRTADGESLGEISDFIVDLGNNRVHYVVIDADGGDRFAIPVQDMRVERETRLAVDTSVDRLTDAPRFERDAALRDNRIYRYERDSARWGAPGQRDDREETRQETERRSDTDLRREDELQRGDEFGAPPPREREKEPTLEEERRDVQDTFGAPQDRENDLGEEPREDDLDRN